jgi:prevent-host-death family protein
MTREVGLREFKNKVSGYIERVEAGEVVTVTKRGKPVARVIPASVSAGMARLIAEGRLHWSGAGPTLPKPLKLKGKGRSAAGYVAEGRR